MSEKKLTQEELLLSLRHLDIIAPKAYTQLKEIVKWYFSGNTQQIVKNLKKTEDIRRLGAKLFAIEKIEKEVSDE